MGEQMVFRPNVVLRILLWFSIIAVGQFPLICSAQTAAKNQTQMRRELSAAQNDLKSLKDSLAADEKKIDALQVSPPLTEEQKTYLKSVDALRGKFTDIQKNMDQTAEHVSGTEMNISNTYIQMLALLVTLAGISVAVFGTLASIIIEKIVSAEVQKKAQIEIDKIAVQAGEKMSVRSRSETNLARAGTFALLAFAWYQHYEQEFQNCLKSRKTPTVLKDSQLARTLSESGIKILDAPDFGEFKDDEFRPWSARATLTNLLVFNTTAFLLCKPSITNEEEETTKLLSSAEACLVLAKDKHARERHWFELYQTAAFAMIKLGHEGTQRRGRALMLGLLRGDRPGNEFKLPDQDWRQSLWDECFVSETTPDDVLGLAETPPRPS
jgi:hypothetical protein